MRFGGMVVPGVWLGVALLSACSGDKTDPSLRDTGVSGHETGDTDTGDTDTGDSETADSETAHTGDSDTSDTSETADSAETGDSDSGETDDTALDSDSDVSHSGETGETGGDDTGGDDTGGDDTGGDDTGGDDTGGDDTGGDDTSETGETGDDTGGDDTGAGCGEELCDGIDNDCDGEVDEEDAVDAAAWHPDEDGDGYGDPEAVVYACELPAGAVADATDCDDGDSGASPGGEELCDGADNDCDGAVDEGASDAVAWYTDGDGDGYGDAEVVEYACEAPAGTVADATDCDDTRDDRSPGGSEVCDGVDNDCDEVVDEDSADARSWYADEDGDRYGDSDAETVSCEALAGAVADATDCDDGDADVHPSADEVCDEIDNDCDGSVDVGASDAPTWYVDEDGDDYGDPDAPVYACEAPAGAVADDSDCDDGDESVHPDADEVCDDLDDDCDGSVDEAAVDASTWHRDGDGDGYGDPSRTRLACDAPSGYVADATDCDDGDGGAYPDADEVCDDLDNDCDDVVDEDAIDAPTWYTDSDGDGYGDADAVTVSCDPPSGSGADSSDCDDRSDQSYPGADELCDDADNDCDDVVDEGAIDAPTWYTDSDGDGYGDPDAATTVCDAPTGSVSDATDCDDGADQSYPGADEVCDDADNDCDGRIDEDAVDWPTWYTDADADGHGDPADGAESCDPPSGAVDLGDDCDDADPYVYTGAPELCDGQDNDCQDNASWTEDDEAGLAAWMDAETGAWTDWTEALSEGDESALVNVSLDSSGTLALCSGTWHLSLDQSGGDITYQGLPGAEPVVIDGANLDQILRVRAGATANVNALTFTRGVGVKSGLSVVGGAILAEGDLTVSESAFTSNEVTGTGGAIACSNATVRSSDNTFTGNSARRGGAIGAVSDSEPCDLYSADDVFSENLSTDYGGALHADPAPEGVLVVSGGLFEANMTDGPGGALSFSGSAGGDLTISDSVFSDNLAGGQGGAVWLRLTDGGDVRITGSTFESNLSSAEGGGVLADMRGDDNTGLFSECTFTGNESVKNGGGLSFDLSADVALSLNGLMFSDNATEASGGGLAVDPNTSAPTVTATDLTFTTNTTTSSLNGGGGLYYVSGAGSLSLTGAIFEGNEAGEDGGGANIQAQGGVSLDGVVFSTNLADDAGGALYVAVSTGSVSLTDIDATDNEAGSHGGGLYLSLGALTASDLVVTGNNLTDSSSARGGGLYMTARTSADISGCDVSDNSLSGSGGGGGGMYLDAATSSATLSLSDCTVEFNLAGSNYGGGLYMDGLTSTLTNVEAAYNSAGRGGGIYADTTTGLALSTGTLLSLNTATTYGGGLYQNGGVVSCSGSSSDSTGLLGNTAGTFGGGLYLYSVTGASFTGTSCDMGSASADNNYVGTSASDIYFRSTTYNYSDDATFTCSGSTCR